MGVGAAHAAFRRALDRRHLAQAIAAARWLARCSLEHRGVDLAETGLAHAAVTAIRNTTRRRAGLLLLLALAQQHQTRELAKVLERQLRTSR
jgi:hypothetical protein